MSRFKFSVRVRVRLGKIQIPEVHLEWDCRRSVKGRLSLQKNFS